jgi:ABC-2 type transport system permease protein
VVDKTLVIAKKGIKQLWRNKRNLVFVIIFPIMFMVVFRIAMGVGQDSNYVYPIAVVDLDTGAGPWNTTEPPWIPYMNQGQGVNMTAAELFHINILQNASSGGAFFVDDVLRKAVYESGGTKLFTVREFDTVDAGWKAVSDKEVVALVVIPANFSSALQGQVDKAVGDEIRAHGIVLNYTRPAYGDATVALSGELTNFDYSFSAQLVNGHLQGYTQGLYYMIRAEVGKALPGGPVSEAAGSVGTVYTGLKKENTMTMFDQMVPGLMVFGLMMQAMGVTATLGMEKGERTLNRLKLTKMTSFNMLGGTTIRWLVLGVVQLALFISFALLIGAKFEGYLPATIAGVMVIGLVVVLASISLGLIISAFVDDAGQATRLSVVIVMPMAFLTGTFFPVNIPGIGIVPWAQGASAMRQMMLYSAWDQAMYHAAICLVGAVVMFAIGVFVYSRKRLRAE